MTKKLQTSPQNYLALVTNWLISKVCYLDKSGVFFCLLENGLNACSPENPKVVLLSRFAYEESTEVYPISSRSALKKILIQQQTNQLSYFFIGPLVSGHRTVITIKPKQNILEKCKNAKVVIPISILIAFLPKKGFYSVEMPDGVMYLANNGINSAKSLPANALITDSDYAAQVLGVAKSTSSYRLAAADLPFILKNVVKIPASYLTSCINRSTDSFNFKKLIPFVGVSLFVASFYLFFATKILANKVSTQRDLLNNLNAQISPILDKRTAMLSADELVFNLQALRQGAVPSEALWDLIATAQLNNITLNRVDGDLKGVNVQGVAASATDFMQTLLDKSTITSAEFASPIRKDNSNRDVFNINIVFNGASPNSEDQEDL